MKSQGFAIKKMLKLFLILLPAALCSLYASSQPADNGFLKGMVFTKDGQPAWYVAVELQQLRLKTITDKKGNFYFQHLPAIHDTLIITGTGLKPYKQPVELDATKEIFLKTIEMDFDVTQLPDVEITGRTAQSYKSDYSFFTNKTATLVKDIPQSVSTITKEMITDKMQFSLKEAADDVAGVNQYSGYDEYTIRGMRAENPHNINGLRGYNTTYTSSMLVNIERVEIIKGPAATLYGNSDPGGTINLVTKKPLNRKEYKIDVYGGSWDHFRTQADATGPLNKKKTILYRLNGGYDKTNSFRHGLYAKSYELAPSLSYIADSNFNVNIDFSVAHTNSAIDRGQPGLLNDVNLLSTPIQLSLIQPGDHLHETDIAAVISAFYKINKRLIFNTGFLHYITQQYVAEHGLHSYITPDSVYLYYTTWNYHTTTNTLTNYLTYKFNSGKTEHQLLFGYDFVQSSLERGQQYYELPDLFGSNSGIAGIISLKNPVYNFHPASNYKLSDYDNSGIDIEGDVYRTHGVYIQDQLSFKKWKLLVGMRQEFYKSDDDDEDEQVKENIFLPKVGLVYAIKPNISLYATFNKGFDPFEASATLQVFNQPFKPLISKLAEAGAKGNFIKNKLAASLALYQLTVNNVAVNANDMANPDLYMQQGANRSRGIEAEATGNILPNVSVSLAYAYCVAKVIKSTVPTQVGMLAENAPKNASNSWLKYTFPNGTLKGLSIEAGHSQSSVRNTLTADIKLPAFYIINTGIQYTYKHTIVALNLNNLTNKTYWLAAYNNVNKWPGQPRSFLMRVGYQF